MCTDVRAYKGLSGRRVRAILNCKRTILYTTIPYYAIDHYMRCILLSICIFILCVYLHYYI